MEPFAVCGLHAGAWPAALVAAGMGMDGMEKALHQAERMGRRMIAPVWYERMTPLPQRVCEGERLNRMLAVQTGQRVLSLCPGIAVFPMRMLRTGQRVVFSTRPYMPDSGAMLVMQAGVSFAARAAMGFAPFLSPMQYMGSALAGETDVAFACRQLLLLGAHRVLVIRPHPSPRSAPDALDLASGALDLSAQPLQSGAETGILRITMPESIGALSLDRLAQCADAGQEAAAQRLDELLERMGMARCRVLAFRRRMS